MYLEPMQETARTLLWQITSPEAKNENELCLIIIIAQMYSLSNSEYGPSRPTKAVKTSWVQNSNTAIHVHRHSILEKEMYVSALLQENHMYNLLQ